METFQKMRQRVADEIKTTFATAYTSVISFEEMLQPEIIKKYAKQATGEKYLVNPHKDWTKLGAHNLSGGEFHLLHARKLEAKEEKKAVRTKMLMFVCNFTHRFWALLL